jgi:glyoxylase-like metal-dependent hydrolase (beta-lactamase superfamily II)
MSYGKRLFMAAFMVGTALAALTVHAQTASEPTYKVVKLADGVYAAMARADVRTNSGIIVNRDNVVVVDAPLLPSWGRDLITEIKKITPKPVRYVITTHYHGDHVYGNQAILEAYGPSVDFIAQIFTRTDIINLDLPGLPNTGKTAPANIARLEKELADGKDPDGNVLDAGTRTAVQGQLAVQKGMLSEYQKIKPVIPTITYDSDMVLHLAHRDIELHHPNRAHTRGDTLIFLPKEKILFTGDVFATSIPNMGSSYPVEWVDTITQMRKWDWDTVVTGHEGVQHGKAHMERWNAYLTDLVAKTKDANSKGMTLEQAQKSIDLTAYAGDFSNFKLFNPTAIARAWAEITNQIKE